MLFSAKTKQNKTKQEKNKTKLCLPPQKSGLFTRPSVHSKIVHYTHIHFGLVSATPLVGGCIQAVDFYTKHIDEKVKNWSL